MKRRATLTLQAASKILTDTDIITPHVEHKVQECDPAENDGAGSNDES